MLDFTMDTPDSQFKRDQDRLIVTALATEELTSSSEPPEKSSEPPPKEPASGLPGLSETPSEEPEGDG